MDVEFADIRISDEVTVTMKLYYWLTLVDWFSALGDIDNIPIQPASARIVISKVTEAITTEPFRKAWQAQHAEAHSEHPVMRIIRMMNGEESEGIDPRDE